MKKREEIEFNTNIDTKNKLVLAPISKCISCVSEASWAHGENWPKCRAIKHARSSRHDEGIPPKYRYLMGGYPTKRKEK